LPADVVMGCLTERVWNPKASHQHRPLFALPMSYGKPAKGTAGCQGDSRKEVTRVRLPRSERPDVRV
jgi:hypothetical protein